MTTGLFIMKQAGATADRPSLPVKTVVLVGDRSLAMDISNALAKNESIAVRHWETLEELAVAHPRLTDETVLVIGLSIYCHPAFDRAVQHWCREQGLSFLRIGIWQHEAVIGPFVLPDRPGCVTCAEIRRIRALTTEANNELDFLAWCEDVSHLQGRALNPWLTGNARQIIGLTIARDIETFIQQGVPAMGFHTVRFLRLRTLTNRCHTFLPDASCDICAQPRDDCAGDALLHFQPRPRLHPASYRVRSILNEVAALEERFVDHRLGLQIRGLHGSGTTFATTVTRYFEYPSIKQDTSATGIAYAFRASRATAILEALERSCGFLPKAKHSVVYGSYEQLQQQAINPEQFGLIAEQQDMLQKPNGVYHLVPYTSTMPFYWVWAYSLRQQRPVLVPEQIAYYGTQAIRPKHEQFVFETSNGCAVGGSLEDATLHGLCEVIERDAFFLTWYTRRPVPAIDWRSTQDTDLLLAIERSMRMTGFTFHAFDCTTDLGLPVILVMAVNSQDSVPKVLLGASAHIDPDKALATAFFEAAVTITQNLNRPPEELERGKRFIEDSSLILSIDDHLLVGAMPEAFSRFSFLFGEQPLQTMQERFAAHYARQPSMDLTEELFRLVEQISYHGHDVIIVDQTSPELREAGFCCVRVLVPGLIPLTFGHLFRRTRHLDRLYLLPKELGYADHILTESELNPDPHAFP
ncbi:MAG TPA: TOMM precursor leader peptide-binding protein [Ktedonobacteraceae bacterium]|nr:TOMM precursor leader peptide-binding protein [Ktedonobacteraceae bacterium]